LAKEKVEVMNNKDKVRGAFLGVAIGDALGKPIETFSYEKIKEKHGLVRDYLDCSGHKWFDGDQKGTVTDDTQLTLAVARAMIKSKGFDLNSIAQEHVNEYKVTTAGWGSSTREAIKRIIDGVAPNIAGYTETANRGGGNGVCMKIAPVGLLFGQTNIIKRSDIAEFSMMTHWSSIAASSAYAHLIAVALCYQSNPKTFNRKNFVQNVVEMSEFGETILPETLTDKISDRFRLLTNYNLKEQEIIETYGKGSCYVYDSLPFSYAFFLRDPNSIDSLYECVSCGGDTDSNASMVGCLLGALHGTKIFPKRLINGLVGKDDILAVADEFFDQVILH
jgi:ADP-ribosyl-[dinitrogen reductase] hydrolase